MISRRRWSDDEEQYILLFKKNEIDIYEIAKKLNRTVDSVVSKIKKLLGCDFRNRIIGSKRRATNHYNLIINRLKDTGRPKNKTYKGIKMLIDKEAFIKWFMENDFIGASVDRIDKNKDYSFDNIQLIPLSENIRKDKLKAKNGMCECFVCHQTKPLEEFVKDSRRITGRTTICLDCERKRGREKYIKSKF